MSKDSKALFQNEDGLIQSFSLENGFTSKRKEAYDLWKNCPIPTSRDEYWKYTRVAPLLNKTYGVSDRVAEFDSSFLRSIDAYNLVFINGIFSEAHSNLIQREDLIICDLNTAKTSHKALIEKGFENNDALDYFSLLNTAFHQNGPFIWAGKNVKVDKPVRLLHICSEKDRMVNVKGFVFAENGSEIHLIETWDNKNSEDNLINSQIDYSVGDNAVVELTKIQSIGSANSLINQEFIAQAANSSFTSHTISMDGKMIRNNINASLNGEGSTCNLNGLYMLKGDEHVDNHTLVIHAVPHCDSNELYKGIINEKAKGVFNGKVIVAKDAQKTNAFQYNANLLLTDDAQIYSKPELEIYADDVKCSHGSTTGQIDEEALFYLQSRGIGKEQSRNLMLQAFAREVLDKISIQGLKEKIDSYITNRYYTGGEIS